MFGDKGEGVKARNSRLDWRNSMAYLIARVPVSQGHRFFLAGVSFWEMKRTGGSSPSNSCERTTPSPFLDVSVCSMKAFFVYPLPQHPL